MTLPQEYKAEIEQWELLYSAFKKAAFFNLFTNYYRELHSGHVREIIEENPSDNSEDDDSEDDDGPPPLIRHDDIPPPLFEIITVDDLCE
jgi:hypothetical protein